MAGLGGEKKYSDAFQAMAANLVSAAEKRLGMDPARIVSLGEKEATRESVGKALRDVASRAAPGDVVFVLLIGHGSYQQGEARFNLRGPDMTAADFVPLLEGLAAQTVVFVNAASASGDFVKPLMGKNRAIVTATKSAQERNETAFGQHFVAAYTSAGADADKDERVSVLEAFEYARREAQRSYEKDRRLLTEHAVLEDGQAGGLARTLGGCRGRRLPRTPATRRWPRSARSGVPSSAAGGPEGAQGGDGGGRLRAGARDAARGPRAEGRRDPPPRVGEGTMKRAVGAVLLAGLGLSGGAASVQRGAAARAEASPAPRGRNLVAEVNLAIQRHERGELEEAKRGFRGLVAAYNANDDLSSEELVAVARACRYLGHDDPQLFKDALKAFDEAIAKGPANIDARVRLAEVLPREIQQRGRGERPRGGRAAGAR